jgi:hypothetical protein
MKNRNTRLIATLSALACFALCQQVQSAIQDDPVPVSNTADGQGALASITTGLYNTAFGFLPLLSLTDANFDTGVGAGALLLDNGGTNTAVGAGALLSNTTGSANTAVGTFALFTNADGSENNAIGINSITPMDATRSLAPPRAKMMRSAISPWTASPPARRTQAWVMTCSTA